MHQSSDILRHGTPARLAKLRATAAAWSAKNPHAPLQNPTWRQARFGTLKSSDKSLAQGFNGSAPVWYTFGAGWFNECDASQIGDGFHDRHTGWYTDGEACSELAIGIVGKLPHGRYIAGYRITMNDERVWFPDIHGTLEDAAHAADERARIIGESESEYSNRWCEAQRITESIEENKADLARHFALRHHRKFSANSRAAIADIIAAIRESQKTLQTDYSDVEV